MHTYVLYVNQNEKIMKNLIHLMTIVIAITLMSFSCCKDEDPIVDEGLITLEELDGVWNFVSFKFGDTEYNCSSPVLPENMINMFISMAFNVDEKTVYINPACNSHSGLDYDFTKDANTIKFNPLGSVDNDVKYVFAVIGYSGGQLKISVDQTPFIYPYITGVITLIK